MVKQLIHRGVCLFGKYDPLFKGTDCFAVIAISPFDYGFGWTDAWTPEIVEKLKL